MNRTDVIESSFSIEDRSMAMLACELHDGPCQHLMAALCHLDAYRHQQSLAHENGGLEFYRGLAALRRGIEELRGLLRDIQPVHGNGVTLLEGIQDLIEENATAYGLMVTFLHTPQEFNLSPVLKTAVLRIVQEGLANVRRHSRSKAVRVELANCDDWLRIEIEDWGAGFDPATIGRDCFGLAGIRARSTLLGGAMCLMSKPGEGTLLVVDLPVPAEHDESPVPEALVSSLSG